MILVNCRVVVIPSFVVVFTLHTRSLDSLRSSCEFRASPFPSFIVLRGGQGPRPQKSRELDFPVLLETIYKAYTSSSSTIVISLLSSFSLTPSTLPLFFFLGSTRVHVTYTDTYAMYIVALYRVSRAHTPLQNFLTLRRYKYLQPHWRELVPGWIVIVREREPLPLCATVCVCVCV